MGAVRFEHDYTAGNRAEPFHNSRRCPLDMMQDSDQEDSVILGHQAVIHRDDVSRPETYMRTTRTSPGPLNGRLSFVVTVDGAVTMCQHLVRKSSIATAEIKGTAIPGYA